MSFPRHGEIYRSDVVRQTTTNWGPGAAFRWSAPGPSQRTRRKGPALLIVHDEFPVGYSSAGCSPAEPASASPADVSMRWGMSAGNCLSANGNRSLISVSQSRSAVQPFVSKLGTSPSRYQSPIWAAISRRRRSILRRAWRSGNCSSTLRGSSGSRRGSPPFSYRPSLARAPMRDSLEDRVPRFGEPEFSESEIEQLPYCFCRDSPAPGFGVNERPDFTFFRARKDNYPAEPVRLAN